MARDERPGPTEVEAPAAMIVDVAAGWRLSPRLELRGFGTFKVRDQKARTGRNPQTGEAVNIPAKRVAVFKASKQLAEQVNG